MIVGVGEAILLGEEVYVGFGLDVGVRVGDV